jgi:hypothetical protein
LDQQPANDRIRYRDLVNIAPLQLGEEVVDSNYYIVGLRIERRGISEIIEVCILTLGHSSSRTHASYP